MPSRIDPAWVPPVAHRQRGVFTRLQAYEAGLTRRQVDHRLRTRVWQPVVGKGLASASSPVSASMLGIAAWLTRPGTVLLGAVAAAFHGAPVPPPDVVDVWSTTPGDDRFGRIRPRHVRLDAWQITRVATVGGVPVQAACRERAFVDALAWLPPAQARDLHAWLASRELLSPGDLEARFVEQPRARGNPQVRRIRDLTTRGAQSRAEDIAHDLLDRAGIQGWQADVPVTDGRGVIGRADILFPVERVVVEIDGRAAHEDQFQGDRSRDNRMSAAGYLVLRFTYDDLTRRPAETIRTLRAVLASRRP